MHPQYLIHATCSMHPVDGFLTTPREAITNQYSPVGNNESIGPFCNLVYFVVKIPKFIIRSHYTSLLTPTCVLAPECIATYYIQGM